MSNKKHLEYLSMAYQYAMKNSTDPSTQVGALLVDDEDTIWMLASNHFPEGVTETKERWERPIKYKYVEHAERNLIYKAAKHGIPTEGKTLYCTWYACADCARAIIQAGIKKVVGHQFMIDNTPEHWRESIDEAFKMLEEAVVECIYVPGDVGDVEILFNGELVRPH